MAIDFPASPTNGQQFTAAGVTWTWDSVKWAASGASAQIVGGIGDSKIINGDMRIDQRNNGASGTAAGYTVDRWGHTNTQSAKGTWGQNLNAVVGPVGFPYYLGFQSASAYALLSSDTFLFSQVIEADAVSDFAWGVAGAQSVTLSFWVRSSLIGMFSGVIQNNAGTRSYPFTFSISTANTWTKIVVTIPGDTAGTWVMSGNGGSVLVRFDLGSGATYRAAAGAWANGNLVGATGTVSIVATNAATFYVTGVKLETGSVATPYSRQSLAKSMADCERYYSITTVWGYYYAVGIQYVGSSYALPTTMRALPTITLANASYTNSGSGSPGALSANSVNYNVTAATQGIVQYQADLHASAEL